MKSKLLGIFLTLVVVLTIGIIPLGTASAATQNAAFYSQGGGTISPTGGTVAECIAIHDDGKFVQMGPGSWVILKFAGNYAAVPDGTSAPDLQVNTYDVPYPADAEISVSLNGTTWISVGTYEDTANIDLDLEVNGPVKYVKVDQGANYIDPAYPTLGFDLDAVVALNAGIIPYGSITSPTEAQEFHPGNAISFDAVYWDDDYDAVQWAVRPAGQVSGGANVWGNVDGSNDPYTWDGHIFHSLAPGSETITWPLGDYYAFVWNPTNDTGESDIRIIRNFKLVNDAPTANPNGPYLGAINVSIAFDGTGSSDPDGDTLTYAWDFGDGNTGTGASPSHTYSAPGIYTVTLVVSDPWASSTPVTTTAVIYDPSAGFVTGGGWIMSPAGAYTADPTLAGKATFGFVSKYQKGANIPTGNTEFQFHAAGMAFKSTSYEWLVVSGKQATFKGEGTINGAGTYKFMITAVDNAPDSFRIKILDGDAPVYDNGSQQAIGGGSIVVHTK